MLVKRRLTRFEIIGLSALGIIALITVPIILIATYVHISNKHNEDKVHAVANQLASPNGCHRTKLQEFSVDQEFGTSHQAIVIYSCNLVNVNQAVNSIKENSGTVHYDNSEYSELDKKANYPDVRARFSYPNKAAGNFIIWYELQDKTGNLLMAPDRATLNQLPVEQIKVEISL